MRRPDSIVPELCVHDASAALEFYKAVFNAVEQKRMLAPGSEKILHAELTIGAHRVIVFDQFTAEEGGTLRAPRALGGTGVRLILEVEDADEAVAQAAA